MRKVGRRLYRLPTDCRKEEMGNQADCQFILEEILGELHDQAEHMQPNSAY